MSPSRGRGRGRSRSGLLAAVVASLGVLGAPGCAGRTSPPPQSSGTAAAQARASGDRPERTARTLGWISLGVGAEAAVVALVTSGMMLHEQSVRGGGCDDRKICTTAGFDANLSLGQTGGWNAAAWIVALSGLGVGSYLLWRNPSDGGSHAEVAVDPVGTGVGLGVRSRF